MKVKHNLQNYVKLVHKHSLIELLLFEIGCYQCPTMYFRSPSAPGSIAAGFTSRNQNDKQKASVQE
jgi:hypothetical protein